MSTSQTLTTDDTSTGRSHSTLEGLWLRWKKKRRRDRARLLAQVRFRLTREGWHFLSVLVFIFVGAVIREINLLILLAGTMIGLLLLHWRFNSQTLRGLSVRRDAPSRTSVGVPTEVALVVSNSRRWLGAWLILAEDQLQKVTPSTKRLTEKGVALIDEVQPQRKSTGRYELQFKERGRYRIGETTISTRFPIGLGRGWRTVDNAVDIIVHPRRGKLLQACRSLLRSDREGSSKAVPRSSVHEGEFYGLRDWQTGDSKRWIHWRTTAKKGELSVRQFEQLQRQQLSVALDLYHPKSKPTPESSQVIEQAIAFAATLALDLVNRDHDKLAFALVGKKRHILPNVQSVVLVNNLLDHLAELQPSSEPQMSAALGEMSASLMHCPTLLVISTRPNQMPELTKKLSDFNHRLLRRLQVRWLDVSAGELETYFEWSNSVE